MKTKSSVELFIVLLFATAAIAVIAGLFWPESPIVRATQVCEPNNSQPDWVTSDDSDSQETWDRKSYFYDSSGYKVEKWTIYLNSFVIEEEGGRTKMSWFYSGYFQIEYEYRSWPFSYWVTPALSGEEYQSYSHLADSLLADLGGHDRWQGVNQGSYTLYFDRDNRLAKVTCPNTAVDIVFEN